MSSKFEESIHQEFERFMRDEMDDNERIDYIKSERYESMVKNLSEILIEKNLKNF